MTEFPLLKPPAKKGYRWESGRLTKIQETSRPPNIWPETWDKLSTGQRKHGVLRWKAIGEIESLARQHRGLFVIPEEAKETYTKCIADVKKKLEPGEVPAMPVVAQIAAVSGIERVKINDAAVSNDQQNMHS